MHGDMILTAAPRSPEMEAAHAHPQVMAAAAAFLGHPVDGMVKLLAAALTSKTDRARHRSMILTHGVPREAEAAAAELLEAVHGLWGPVDDTFLRGALLEKVVRGLLDGRRCVVLEEQRVGPLDGGWWRDGLSDPIDFVLPEQPEMYECKANVRRIEGRHLNQFVLIQEIDRACLTAFVTLMRAQMLVDWLEEFTCERPIHAFTFEDFLALGTSPAQQVVAGPA